MDTTKKTIIVFSGDLDKLMAAFVIAVGAAAMGNGVTMFFTFWGLNALRRDSPPPVRKSFMSRMFGWLMPRGAAKAKLSKLNMGGMGTAMMRRVMRNKHVDSVEQMLSTAQEFGVRLIACTMSMDVMGIAAAELIEGVELGGVASYLGAADEASVNLFI
jgi:peroxiredoxin family protein